MIHISTDYVFDGQSNSPYDEESIPYPINEYGISKFVAESILNQSYEYKAFIIRVSTLFGYGGCRAKGGRNLIDTIIRNLNKGEPFSVHCNVFVSPSYAVDVSSNIYELIKGQFSTTPPPICQLTKILHFTNSEYCSLYELALFIKDLINSNTEILESECNDRFRPKFTALRTNHGVYRMSDWKSAVERYIV